MNTAQFVTALTELHFPNVFNPYSQTCPSHDVSDAPAIRRRNLEIVLDAAIANDVDSIWVGRDLGYRGGRRTGLALTDEAHLSSHGAIFGCQAPLRATWGPAVSERTATVIWDTLTAVRRPVFLWNVFPLHPHEAGDPLSNRCHTRAERQACREIMEWLLTMLSPRRVVAIGRDAQAALSEMNIPSTGVRHPSYGGQIEFISGIADLYNLPRMKEREGQLTMSFEASS
ncbi:uracil-DNA glycosylase [Methylocapsa sp. S129]|uniref:uracil-DNA glycosylase n=1 Tax=Methylocapsa sp. S129 TaxID=1641869 RepID=UPI00131B91DC|nr:uracil-DNA glycosylase [Methylocapsa sp. S129]